MLCYKDQTFCTFYDTCSNAKSCFRAYTPEVHQAAVKWWGNEDAPVATFRDKPSCHSPITTESI